MIEINTINIAAIDQFDNKQLSLSGDNTGNNILYLYCDDSIIVHSYNEKLFFEYLKKQQILKFEHKNFSYLLLNNIIPYPNSIYKNVFLLSYGDSVTIEKENNKFKKIFSFDFPYSEEKSSHLSTPSTDVLFEKICMSLEDINSQDLLSLSSGKDSMTILLGLAELGKKVDTFTYKSPGSSDETDYVQRIIKRFGFKNTIIDLQSDSSDFLNNYDLFYSNINIPSVDQAQLSYLNSNMSFYKNKNIIDGSGSDIYIGHIPFKEQYYLNYLSLAQVNKKFIKLQHKVNIPENKAQSFFFKSVAANNGMYTWFSYPELKEVFSKIIDTSSFWYNYEINHNNDFIDYRAMTRGRFLDSEMFMRKVRNISYHSNSNTIFPWTNKNIIDYWFNLPKDKKYSLNQFKNKILLRVLLNEKLNYNIPKKGFEFDLVKFLIKNKTLIISEVSRCKIFNKNIDNLLDKYFKMIETNTKIYIAKRKLQLLFQLSLFINRHEELL